MKIAYIHGFNCAAKMSEKTGILNQLGNLCLFEYENEDYPMDIYRSLQEQIQNFEPDIIVGTSLGGYWAGRMAYANGLMAVMINPSVEPHQGLLELVGDHVNYVNAKEYTLTQDVVESYDSLTQYDPFGVVLLDQNDEIINAETTKEQLEDMFSIVTFEGGCHQFDHMEQSLPIIEKAYNTYKRSI